MDRKHTTQQEKEALVHGFSTKEPFFTNTVIIILFGMIIVGLISGFVLAKTGSNGTASTQNGTADSTSSLAKGTVIGSEDTKTFNDTVEGIVKEGGIEGEGQYHLVRPGGDSQNVYMTSSIIDLVKVLDKKVKVWGQTQKAQTAGWLMDVGRVEVLE